MAKQEKSAAELYREERKARLAKAAKKNSKKTNKIIWSKKGKSAVSVIVVLALIIGIAGIVLNSMGMFERGKKVMTVDGVEVDKYELAYYSSRIYDNLFQNSYQYDSYYGEGYGVMVTGYDWSKTPDNQSYPTELEGYENPTFADYIEEGAKNQIKLVKTYVKYAEENGIVLDDTDKAGVTASINELKQTALKNNYGYANFIRSEYCYGEGMTPDLLEKILTEAAIAEKVEHLKAEEFAEVYTSEKVEEIYLENLTTYGVVSYRSYVVSATEEADTTATEAEMAAAKAKADSLAKAADENAFLAEVAEIEDNDKYLTDDTLTLKTDAAYSGLVAADDEGKLADWMFSSERTAGETYVFENAGKGYTVCMISEPVHKVAPTYDNYDVRHILVKFPEEAKEETTEENKEETTETEEEKVTAELLDTSAYDAVIDIDVDVDETKDPALYMKAQGILEEYLKGEMTEDAFGELAKKYSEDGNADEGGIYEDVASGQMVSEFEDWALLAADRKAGDVGIVETEFGYHIMYFIEREEVSNWETEIRDEKSTEDLAAFGEELLENVVIADFNTKHAADIRAFVKTLSRNSARQYSSTSTFTY